MFIWFLKTENNIKELHTADANILPKVMSIWWMSIPLLNQQVREVKALRVIMCEVVLVGLILGLPLNFI